MRMNLERYLRKTKGCVVAKRAKMTDANVTNIKKCIKLGTMWDCYYTINSDDTIDICVTRKLGRN